MAESITLPAAITRAESGDAPPIAGPVIAGVFGLAWFVRWTGWHPLDPTNLGWLLNGADGGTQLLGWLFFRNEPWALPVGRITSYVHPVGTTVAFTDSVPWLATLLKPLSPFLPEAFQYIGPWLGLCFALMGLAGALAVRAFSPNPWLQAIGGALFVTSPALIAGLGQGSLSAQWILVAAIAMLLVPVEEGRQARRFARCTLLLSLLAAGIHPQLTAMVLVLSLGLFFRLSFVERLAPPAAAVGGTVVLGVGITAVLALFGYIGDGEPLLLASLADAAGQSRRLLEAAAAWPRGEGRALLGTGALALGAFAITSLALRWREAMALPWRRGIPLALAGAAAVLVSTAMRNATSHAVLRVDAPVSFAARIFDGVGGLVWIAHYAFLAAAILLVIRLWRGGPVAVVALSGALCLQLADFAGVRPSVFSRRQLDAGFRSPAWRTLGAEYQHLALVPPQIAGAGGSCEGEIPADARAPFAYLAYEQRMTINGGNLGRQASAAVRLACDDLQIRMRSGDLERQTVYVPGPASLRALRASRAPVLCGRLDRWAVCVSRERNTRLAEDLRLNPL